MLLKQFRDSWILSRQMNRLFDQFKEIKINLFFIGLFFLMVSLAFVPSNIMAQQESDEVTLTGVVLPDEYDENDNVIAVIISVTITPTDTTEEEYTENYLVADNEKGRELLKLVDYTVKATGTVMTDKNGYLIFNVTDYEIIEAPKKADEPYDEEEPPEK